MFVFFKMWICSLSLLKSKNKLKGLTLLWEKEKEKEKKKSFLSKFFTIQTNHSSFFHKQSLQCMHWDFMIGREASSWSGKLMVLQIKIWKIWCACIFSPPPPTLNQYLWKNILLKVQLHYFCLQKCPNLLTWGSGWQIESSSRARVAFLFWFLFILTGCLQPDLLLK